VNPAWSTNGVEETGAEAIDAEFENVTNLVDTAGTTNSFLKLDVEIEK